MGEKVQLEDLLHTRVFEGCAGLFLNGHYREAATKSLILVEQALKDARGEYGSVSDHGIRLVNKLLGMGEGIKLRFKSAKSQADARDYFANVFKFHRNYLVHSDHELNKGDSLRIMVIASDLLFLIAASKRSYSEIGGVDGLVSHRVFAERDSIIRLLELLSSFGYIPEDDLDGLYEEMFRQGFVPDQVDALIDLGLIFYTSDPYIPVDEVGFSSPTSLGHFETTELGDKLLTNML